MSLGETAIVISVGLIKPGLARFPLKVTVEEVMKFDPLIDSAVICDPAAA
jgi:hypothetical protein